MGWAAGVSGLISGIADNYSLLPTPASNHIGELWYVSDSSGGLLSVLNVYKYPKGIYSPNSSNVWELIPLNVKVAEDSTTLVNIDNWAEFFAYAFDINTGDRLIFSGVEYKNTTGNMTSTAPDTDLTNWEVTSASNTLCVAKRGCSFTSIKDAMDSITDNSSSNQYVVLVSSGSYLEDNPIQCKEYVSIRSVGGSFVTSAIATNTNQNMFDLSNISVIRGINVAGISGTGYAFSMIVAGNASILDCIHVESSNGIYCNNTSAGLNIDNHSVINVSVTTVNNIQVLAGIVTVTKFQIANSSTVTTGLEVNGSNAIVTVNSFKSLSANVTTGFRFTNGCFVSGANNNLENLYDGIVIDGTNTNVRLEVLGIYNPQNDGFRIEDVGTNIRLALFATTIIGSGNLNFNVENANSVVSGNGFTELSKGYQKPGAGFYAYLLDITDGDEGLNILGELHAGTPLNPVECVFGGGDSHTFEYVYTYDGTSTYTDRTAAAASATGSTFQFDGVTAGNAIYIANRYPMTFEGIKIAIDTAATIGGGVIVAEYWNGAWTEFNGCTSQSSQGFFKYAKNYFSQSGSYHIKFNPFMTDDWAVNDPISPALGTNYYWIRFRIVTGITTSPVIQQTKIHTSRAEINTDGTLEYHMDARTYKKLVVDAVKPLEGNMQNASIYVDENVGVGLENNRFTTAGDLLGVSFELPEDCDTSAPLIFVWKGKFASTGNVDFTVRRKIVAPGDAYTNTEPGASGNTLIVLTGSIAVAAANVREDYRVNLDISEAIPSRDGGFGDEIWITVQYPTRGAGNFDYAKLSANYLSDFNGRHVRQ